MKLLSPTQAKEQSRSRAGASAVDAAALETTLARLQARVNAENDRFAALMASMRAEYGAERDALAEERDRIAAEVKTLSEARAALMVPVNSLKREAQAALDAARDASERASVREFESEATFAHLTARLDEVSEREDAVEVGELALLASREGLDSERAQVSAGHARLNDALAQFRADVERTSRELAEGRSALEIEKTRAAEYVSGREAAFLLRETALADREKALAREFRRLKG